MKNIVIIAFLLSLCSCVRTDMDLKTLQNVISKNSFTNKLTINDEMVFYQPNGKRDTRFENYLRKNNVMTMMAGDFNHDGEEDYLANVSNSFNRASAVPSQYFPIIITLKNGKYFIYRLDQFYDAKSVGSKIQISNQDYILLFSKDLKKDNQVVKDTFTFAHNNIMMFNKDSIQ